MRIEQIKIKNRRENKTNRMIVEVFGNWITFRRLIKEDLQNIDYDPLENEATKKYFVKHLLRSYQVPYNYFVKISDLVEREIRRIKK
ncbi:MAG TPA: hypothetical protein ENL06_03005 [Candidatus Portnoybacteria bacterium]|nr:hypothetical protein [Candidatus Portnoybacteria bacterium]